MANLDSLRRDIERKAQVASSRTASQWERQLRQNSPSDTGNMRQKTTVRSTPTATGTRIEAKVDTAYAHILRAGQRPHEITRANPGKFLVNYRSGFEAVSPVSHPGAQGRTWWDDAIRDVPDMLRRNWQGA
jgi:hypothetical protein